MTPTIWIDGPIAGAADGRGFTFHWQFAILLLILVTGCSPRQSSEKSSSPENTTAAPERETWEVCFLQGVRVGYVQTGVYRDVLDGRPVVRTEGRNEIRVNRNGEPVQMKVRFTSIEEPGGGLLRFESVMEMGPQPIRTTGRVVGNRLEMETVTQGKKIPAVLDWPPDCGGFNALEQSLLRRPPRPGERRTLQSLMPGFNEPATIEIFARDWEKVAIFEETKELLRTEVAAILPGAQKIQETRWIDRHGETLKTHSNEMNLDSFRTTKADALRQNAGELFDINVATAVKLDRPIPRAHETQKIRYRLHLEGANPAKVFPACPTQQFNSPLTLGEEQGVRAESSKNEPLSSPHPNPLPKGEGNAAELTVFSIRPGRKDGNLDAPAEQPGDADLRPNGMIQSDDPPIVSLAEEAAGGETDPWRAALKLEKFVHGYIHLKDFSQVFATAAEAAKTREGDCTEHAVLAALCRARKIPARVAFGLVYSERGTDRGISPEFAYHLWVEAFLEGRWIPLDATLGRGGIGAAHLKVAHGNLQGASMYGSFLPVAQVVGKLKIEVLEVE